MTHKEFDFKNMREKAYHDMLALNFLRNISLDGSHNVSLHLFLLSNIDAVDSWVHT